jgi:hypothetical protein
VKDDLDGAGPLSARRESFLEVELLLFFWKICNPGEALLPHTQRSMTKHAQHIVEWETGHSPFINRPKLVAALLIGLSVSS